MEVVRDGSLVVTHRRDVDELGAPFEQVHLHQVATP
jgi:hypothetical protein